MSNPSYREVLAGIWAKSPKHGAATGEPLSEHTWAVVARLSTLSVLFPKLAERVGEPRLWRWAFWACVLHDIGKIAKGFQAQLRNGTKGWGHRHEVLSLAFLEWVLTEERSDDLAWIAAGVASHHRDLDDIKRLYPLDDDPDDDQIAHLMDEVDDSAVEAIAAWLVAEPSRWVDKLGVLNPNGVPNPPAEPVRDFHCSGATRIRRALAAYRRLVKHLEQQPADSPHNLAALALRGLVLLADHTASAHVQPAGPAITDVAGMVKTLGLGKPQGLFRHQELAAACTSHALLTAPTGSGKTEAAILWAACQQQTQRSCGRVYYLLPYQASLNAMHSRLLNHFPGRVALQHSRALQALYRRLLDKQYTPVKAAAVARQEQALARLHHHSIRVLTPYQLLRGAFRLKGYEALFTDTVDGLFIFDEMHAYEPRRLGMILGMMEYLRRSLGGRFLVMSATFPRVLREILKNVLGDDMAAVSADEALYKAYARHTLRLVNGTITDSHVLDRIVQRALSGESVLVTCNTVGTAMTSYNLLRPRLSEGGVVVNLLHGRFNARDRFAKEQQLLARMGTRNTDRSQRAVILIATQVVEVSLDIDFDVLFTEPAPLESLIQRFGRVNRGRRRAASDVHVLETALASERVYDLEYITRAGKVLESHDGEKIDESQIGPWLDSIYEGPVAAKWLGEVNQYQEEFTAACLKDLRAFQSKPELAEAFDQLFDGTEVLPRSLMAEYEHLLEDDPLRASELLVPISSGRLRQLRRAARVLSASGDDPIVVDAPYDSDRGLIFDEL